MYRENLFKIHLRGPTQQRTVTAKLCPKTFSLYWLKMTKNSKTGRS